MNKRISNISGMFLCLFLTFNTNAQVDIVSDYPNRSDIILRVKQVDEFIHRFNFNEKKIDLTQIPVTRRSEIIPLLVEETYNKENAQVLQNFINASIKSPLISFYDDNWYAVVKCEGVYNRKTVRLNLVLQVEAFQNHSSKWVLTGVNAPFLEIDAECTDPSKLISPSNNEVGFIGLQRIFEDKENITAYSLTTYEPDYLSILLHEVKAGRFIFKKSLVSKYYFTQVQDWVFVLEHFNRSGNNSGWLISEVIPVRENQKKQFLYNELKVKI